jgi:uncharacterized membrane protein
MFSCFLVLVVGASAVGACGEGSPAAPIFKSTAVIEPLLDAASSGASGGADATADVGADADPDAAPFSNCKPNPANGAFPADIAAILSARCQPCHQNPTMNGAPFPLLTYQDVNGMFGPIPIYQEMYVLIQPDGSPHMPFRNAPQLTADQLQTLSSWLLACAPPGP